MMQKTLVDLGFTKVEAHVYLHLARDGPKTSTEIAQTFKMRRQQVCKTVKEMQRKGAIEIHEHSDGFFAVPFEKILDLFIKANIEEAQQMLRDKDALLSSWRSLIKKDDNNGSN